MNTSSYINNYKSYWLLSKFNAETNIKNNSHILDAKNKTITMSQLQQCKNHNIIYIFIYMYYTCILYTHIYVVEILYI